MPHAVLIALIIFGVAVAAGLGAAVVTGFQAWRNFRALRRAVLARLGQLNAELAKVERRNSKAGDSAVQLNRARGQLQRTLETAGVVRSAAAESWSLFKLVRGTVPRK